MRFRKIKKYLKKITVDTDFSFTLKKDGTRLKLYMRGYNPLNEDWCEILTIEKPKTKKDLLQSLYDAVYSLYEGCDIEEKVYLRLYAKRHSAKDIPCVWDILNNEDYKERALGTFADKLDRLFTMWDK